MVRNACFAHKKTLQTFQGFFAEALEVTVNLIIAQGEAEGVDLLGLKGGTGKSADEGKLLLGG